MEMKNIAAGSFAAVEGQKGPAILSASEDEIVGMLHGAIRMAPQ